MVLPYENKEISMKMDENWGSPILENPQMVPDNVFPIPFFDDCLSHWPSDTCLALGKPLPHCGSIYVCSEVPSSDAHGKLV